MDDTSKDILKGIEFEITDPGHFLRHLIGHDSAKPVLQPLL